MRAARTGASGEGYGADVSERSSYSSNYPYETGGSAPQPEAPAQLWPVWELQGYGTGARAGTDTGVHGAAAESAVDPDAPGDAPHGVPRGSSGVPRSSGSADGLPPWFEVRLTLPDGSSVEVAAVVEGKVRLEELRADPPLTLQGFAGLAAWIGEPLADVCPSAIRPPETGPTVRVTGACVLRTAAPEVRSRARTRPAVPRGQAARRAAAEAYRAAQERGQDPVLAVMGATGHGRRKSLRVIAGARDAGLLTPRHARR